MCLWNLVTSKYLGCFLAKMSKVFRRHHSDLPLRYKEVFSLLENFSSVHHWYSFFTNAIIEGARKIESKNWLTKVIYRGSITNMLPPFFVLLASPKNGLPGSSEGPKRETTRLQKQLRMIKSGNYWFLKNTREKRHFYRKNPFQVSHSLPMRHLNDRNATHRQGNATPFP